MAVYPMSVCVLGAQKMRHFFCGVWVAVLTLICPPADAEMVSSRGASAASI